MLDGRCKFIFWNWEILLSNKGSMSASYLTLIKGVSLPFTKMTLLMWTSTEGCAKQMPWLVSVCDCLRVFVCVCMCAHMCVCLRERVYVYVLAMYGLCEDAHVFQSMAWGCLDVCMNMYAYMWICYWPCQSHSNIDNALIRSILKQLRSGIDQVHPTAL